MQLCIEATGTLTAGLLPAPSTAHAIPAPAASPVPRAAPLPPTFHTAPHAWTTIRLGDRGTTVTALQRVVDIQGDGVFGPHTFQAVTAWQRSHHLVADGIVGVPANGSFEWATVLAVKKFQGGTASAEMTSSAR